MRVALMDFGVGNLHSLARALVRGGAEVETTTSLGDALRLDALVLPGVGAFGAASARFGGDATIARQALASGHPCLGICLGMQLLFESSEESEGDGIGLLRGKVRRLRAQRTPQMGWNDVETAIDPLFDSQPLERRSETASENGSTDGVDEHVPGGGGLVVYFAHRYVAPEPVEAAQTAVVIGRTTYETDSFPSAIRAANTWGTQFHPEKSGELGLRIIHNFLRAARRAR